MINLLPIPVLDGGHLLYYFVEMLVEPASTRKNTGMGSADRIFIVSIMFLAIYNDLTRL